jgi:hypothetical protein
VAAELRAMLGGLPRTRGVFKKTLSGILASKDNDAARDAEIRHSLTYTLTADTS